ncbi:MAG TPA: hypothetical protein VEN81_01420, partial [Planctomycetota bacterium]|nr:hypothetical protein [Planctomycetota bacterium]
MARAMSVLAREWPLVAAGVAILSLALLPRFARSTTLRAEREEAAIDALRRRVAMDPASSEPQIRAFLASRPESPWVPEARYLLGEAIV